MKNELILANKSLNRFRFICKQISTYISEDSLKDELIKHKGIKDIRINKKAKSIILNTEPGFDLEKFKKYFANLDLRDYELCDTFLEPKAEKTPSKKDIFIAATPLVLTPFLSNTTALKYLSIAACTPLLIDGTKELFSEGLSSRVLEATAVGVSLVRADYIAANSTNSMLALGEYIEESTVHKSDDLIKELAKPNVSEAWVEIKENGKIVEKKVPTKDIKVGDIVVVGIGDTIAIDGHIIDGNASVNQVSMTGEAEPVKKQRGDRVMSGTVIEDGRVRIWAEHVGENTATARIKHYITSSLEEKSSIGLKANKLADNLVPVTLGLAITSYAFNQNLTSVASVLQADYSCALKLATPVAFKTSISQAGKNGILIKGAKALEALANADTFVFDKTGTLTHGRLEVVQIHSYNPKFSEEELLNLTASAEEHYFHPVAEAIVQAAKKRGFVHMHHDEVEFIVAHGVKTYVNGKEVVIGSRHFLEDDEKISFKEYEKDIEKSLEGGLALLYIGYNNELLGTIGMSDKIRDNTKATLKKLKELGAKEIIMLTGDVESKAKSLAKGLEIDKIYSNMLPTDKARIIEELKEQGRHIAFIGDGINDAPSLMKADVGISMQRGADIAKATADISLLKDDIEAVSEAKDIANKTLKLVQQNFNATVGINSGILLGAATGFLSPVTTAVLHNGTTIGLLINSMKGVKKY